jgi:hypothetical protein
MRKLSLLLLLLFAQPLFACVVSMLEIEPPRPTTTDQIEVVMSGGCPDGCVPHHPRVDVAAGTITIELDEYDGCILTPQPWGERVDVGRVPAGTYALIVLREGVEMARRTLVVRSHPFSVKPSFGVQGSEVNLGFHRSEVAKVTFGGVEATYRGSPDGLVARAPNHAPGLVDVVITDSAGNTFTAVQAYRYITPQEDAVDEYERVFFPTSYSGEGAFGSLWTALNYVYNRGPAALEILPVLPDHLLPVVPDPILDPGEKRLLRGEFRDGGTFVYVPRGTEPWLAYASHIADESRRLTDAGTELPVVHERDTGPRVNLLGVPLTNESRQTLRIFDLAGAGAEVVIVVRVPNRPEPVVLTATPASSFACVTTPCFPHHPAYAVINLHTVPQLRGAGRAEIEIRARTNERALWAYVTVTNNETQHVTTWTPQHRRGTLH